MVVHTFNPEAEAGESQSLRPAWSRMARVAQRKPVLENKQLPPPNKRTKKLKGKKKPLSLIKCLLPREQHKVFPFLQD